jgi:hypothetical protein
MKIYVILLKISIAFQCVFLSLILLMITGNPRGGTELYWYIAGYLAIGLLSGLGLINKRKKLIQKTFLIFSIIYIALFFLLAVGLIAFLFLILTQC